jgi:ankyrin repeat protein
LILFLFAGKEHNIHFCYRRMLSGSLWKWHEEKGLTAFSSGGVEQLSLPLKVICIGGLTDGLNACPWIFKLSSTCQTLGWNVIQPLLSSSYLGYGTGSLARDTQEITELINHLVTEHSCEQVVLVGHSTGCQNAIHFLRHAPLHVRSRVVAVALQAPVSDQEAGEMEAGQEGYLQHARQEVQTHGESACEHILMPLHMHYSPITVSRFMALNARYGADDMFSSYLTGAELSERLDCFSRQPLAAVPASAAIDDTATTSIPLPLPDPSRIPVLVAFSLADEYVPDSVDKPLLVSRLASAMGPSAVTLLLEGANHNLSEPADGKGIDLFVDSLTTMISDQLLAPLFTAAREGNIVEMRRLVELGAADVNAQNKDGETPLLVASCYGHVDFVQQLAAMGGNVNTANNDGKTPVYKAAGFGHAAMVTALAELGASIHTPTTCDGATAVCIATQEGYVDVVRVLAGLGADVNTPDLEGFSPLYVSVLNGDVAMLRTLLELGGSVDTPRGGVHLLAYHAAQEGCGDVLRVLADLGADVNKPDDEGFTPMWIAAQKNHPDTIRVLAELGADANAAREDGATPLLLAVEEGYADVVRSLVECGADVDASCSSHGGATPLRIAVHTRSVDMIGVLLGLGADAAEDYVDPKWKSSFVHELVLKFCTAVQCQPPSTTEYDYDYNFFAWFAMTKVLTGIFYEATASVDGSSRSSSSCSSNSTSKEECELSIAKGFNESIPTRALRKTRKLAYPFKRQLCTMAHRVHLESLQVDGDRISLDRKARRYVELVCLFLDCAMLKDVCALRMTCKSNYEIRRFPFSAGLLVDGQLEANLIEGYVGYDACRFVSTSQIHEVIQLHCRQGGTV